MEYIEAINKKIEQYQQDLKLILDASKKIDRIRTARIKVMFEDLIAEQITETGKLIKELKEFVEEESVDKTGGEE